jgi:LuxR family transcriptional regulator, maltose regulon positive regulatory protein
MLAPILATKLYIPPPRPKVVSRPRLIEALSGGLHRKLTLISAPAGFGKTTLVSEWVAGSGEPIAWLSLDEGDNDPARFLTYLIAALQTITPQIGAGVLGTLQSPQPPSPELILTTLLNEIAAVPDHFLFLLDDYHMLDSRALDDALAFLLEHQPPQMHLVITTREDPHLPLSRLRARGQLTELRAADLRFTPSEAAEFLNQVMGLNLPAEDIAALDKRTEGWIAGLQLAALSMQGHQDSASFIKSFTGSHHFVLDYLMEEVLQQQPASIQAFLLRTSILERLCGPLCDAVLLDPSAAGQETLEYLERANLFIVPLDNERHWFRYHHLFRDLLHSSLQKAYPDQVGDLHRRASTWFDGQKMAQEAIAHAFAARDYPRAAGLVEQAAQQLDMQNSLVAITHWIDAIPDEVVSAHPWLCIYRAWGYQWIGRRDSVAAWLEAAETCIHAGISAGQQDADRDHLLGHIAAIRAHAALTGENITRVLEEGHKALALLPEADEMRCETAVAVGGAYWALGRVIDAEQAFATARASALRCSHLTMAVPSTCYMGMQQAKQGRLAVARQTYQDALRLALDPDGRETPVAGFPNIRLGDLYREWNELDRAQAHLARGVEQCTLLGQADVLVDGYICLARFKLATCDPGGARENLQLADQVVAKTKVDPFVQCWLEDLRLRLWIMEEDYPPAARWLETCGLTAEGPFSYHYDLHHTNLARALVALGTRDGSEATLVQAAGLLNRLHEAADQAGWVQEKIHILVLQALAEKALGHGDEAGQALARALALAEPGGFIRLFVDEGLPMEQLLGEAGGQKAAPGYTARLLAAFAGGKPPRPSENRADALGKQLTAGRLSELGEPLSKRELEVLQLIAQGLSNREISARLFLALSTIKGHTRIIFDKLHVERRTEAVARARELGLL